MADNITLNLGSGGSILATEDISSAHYQKIKLTEAGDTETNPLSKAVDAVAGLTDQGIMALVVRNDTLAALAGTDGDYAPLQVNATGALYVAVDGTVTVTSTALTDIETNTNFGAVVGTGVEATALRVTLATDSTGQVKLAAGVAEIGNVANSGTFATQATLQAGTAEIGKLAAGTAEIGSVKWAGTAPPIGAGVEATALRVTLGTDSTGQVKLAAGTAEIGNVTNSGTFATQATITGFAAHGASVTGSPVLNGAEARTTNPTAVTDGQAVRLMADKLGKLVTFPFAPRLLHGKQRTVITSSTAETTIVTAGGAGVFRDLVGLVLSNESATEVRVDIRDATAGSIFLSIDLAPDGGGAVLALPAPLVQATAANNWTATCSASVASVYITAQFINVL